MRPGSFANQLVFLLRQFVQFHLQVELWFFFQAEDGIRGLVRSRGLGDVYKRQAVGQRRTGHPALQLLHLPWEKILHILRVRIERLRRQPVGAGCTADAQIDPSRSECLQHAELLGHLERGVVRLSLIPI